MINTFLVDLSGNSIDNRRVACTRVTQPTSTCNVGWRGGHIISQHYVNKRCRRRILMFSVTHDNMLAREVLRLPF